MARFLILRRLWGLAIDGWSAETIPRLPAARRLLHAGGDRGDVVRVMRAAAYEATFAILYHVAYGSDDEAPEGLPGWQLMELDGEGRHTGRAIDALYESLLTMDPSGRDGADLWE